MQPTQFDPWYSLWFTKHHSDWSLSTQHCWLWSITQRITKNVDYVRQYNLRTSLQNWAYQEQVDNYETMEGEWWDNDGGKQTRQKVWSWNFVYVKSYHRQYCKSWCFKFLKVDIKIFKLVFYITNLEINSRLLPVQYIVYFSSNRTYFCVQEIKRDHMQLSAISPHFHKVNNH